MSAGDEFGKSERPIEPANTRSPESRSASSASVRKLQWPGVCPGVCMTSIASPASRSVSPSVIVRRSFTGCERVVEPGAPGDGVGERQGVRRVDEDRDLVPAEVAGGHRVVDVRVREQDGGRAAAGGLEERVHGLGLEPGIDDDRLVGGRRPPGASSSCRRGSGRRRPAT